MNHISKHSSNIVSILLCILGLAPALLLPRYKTANAQISEEAPQTYLGFDANDYPGDATLPDLRRTFTFSGYWLNVPPGAKTNPWVARCPAKKRLRFFGALQRPLVERTQAAG